MTFLGPVGSKNDPIPKFMPSIGRPIGGVRNHKKSFSLWAKLGLQEPFSINPLFRGVKTYDGPYPPPGGPQAKSI